MNLLAVESSTATGSVALVLNGQLAEEVIWKRAHRRSEESLSVLPDLFQRHQVSATDMDLFAVGRGPGNYSGMRVALSVVNALALPSHQPVYALSSGEVLAVRIAREEPGKPIAIVGDARRAHLWVGLFLPGTDGLVFQDPWSLCDPDQLVSSLPGDTVVATPDWDRLESLIKESALNSLCWLQGNLYPYARDLAEMVLRREKAGQPSEPLTPLYMHPAV